MLSNRRQFLSTSIATATALAIGTPSLLAQPAKKPRFLKGIKYHMIKGTGLDPVGNFKLVKSLGFDGLEIHTRDKTNPEEFVRARDESGLTIHGVVNSSNPDIKSAVKLSKTFGGTSVLVVAGKVSKEVSYDTNYKVWQDRLKQAAPFAEDNGIKLLVENVWNNFLLSPMEMARFLDEINSPAVGAYFDVGNVVRFGYPDQWVRILGDRIGKLDIKEYSRKLQKDEGLWKGFNVEINDGDVDFPAVVKALEEINYTGWGTAEVTGGGKERLQEVADRMDIALQLK